MSILWESEGSPLRILSSQKKILSGEIEQVHFCVACGGCSTLLKSQKVVGYSVYDPYYKEVLKQTKKS